MTGKPKPADLIPESVNTRMMRWGFNLHPVYQGCGARVLHISRNFRRVIVELPLSIRNRNYIGTIFGGAMFSAVDPMHVFMLVHNLGSEYVVWDKSARIHFKRPGRNTLRADLVLDDREPEELKRLLETQRSLERTYSAELVDEDGEVCAVIEKTVYVRQKIPGKDDGFTPGWLSTIIPGPIRKKLKGFRSNLGSRHHR